MVVLNVSSLTFRTEHEVGNSCSKRICRIHSPKNTFIRREKLIQNSLELQLCLHTHLREGIMLSRQITHIEQLDTSFFEWFEFLPVVQFTEKKRLAASDFTF